MSKARDYGIDNLKAIAIFLVVLLHMIRRPFEFNEALYPLQTMIQAFSMPLFVFISGYLGKKTEKHLRSSITDLLIPYVAFNVFYRAIGNHTLNLSIIRNIFTPYLGTWYLLCLFCWRILIIPLARLRKSTAALLSVAASILIGWTMSDGSFLGFGRTLGFLPYYLIGYYCDKETIEKVRRVPKAACVAAVVILEALAVWLVCSGKVPLEAVFNSRGYAKLGQSVVAGAAFRLGNMASSFILIAALIALVPNRPFRWSAAGKNSLYIYLYHLIACFAFKWAVNRLGWTAIGDSLLLGCVVLIPLSLLVTWLCQNKYLIRCHEFVWGKISTLLLRPEPASREGQQGPD